jgi:hypothetical protein
VATLGRRLDEIEKAVAPRGCAACGDVPGAPVDHRPIRVEWADGGSVRPAERAPVLDRCGACGAVTKWTIRLSWDGGDDA